MSTAVKQQWKVLFLSVKYNIMRDMVNPITFITNVLFMMLNNSTFIIQWLIIFQFKDNIGGYSFREVMFLWALTGCSYGLAHILFHRAFSIPDLIINGKLDSFLVQPKNILLSVISSSTSCSAIGDVIYGILILLIFQTNLSQVILFILLCILSTLIQTAFGIILGSLSFWIPKGDILANTFNNLLINFTLYPEGIFKGFTRFFLYAIVPVGFVAYLPIKILTNFHVIYLLYIFLFTIAIILIAFLLFYKGLKRYSSSNLMVSRM